MSKRKRRAEEAMQKRFQAPEDNEMRQKLRGSAQQADMSATEDDSRAQTPNRERTSETESITGDETDPTISTLVNTHMQPQEAQP